MIHLSAIGEIFGLALCGQMKASCSSCRCDVSARAIINSLHSGVSCRRAGLLGWCSSSCRGTGGAGGARPDQVTGVTRQPRRGQGGRLAAQLPPVPPVRAQQGLHPVPALMTGRLRDRPAVRLRPRRQRAHVPGRDLRAAPLRQHPAQNHPDLRVNPRGARRDVLYPGPCGRVVSVSFHKAGTASRPPQVTGGQLPPQPSPGHSPSPRTPQCHCTSESDQHKQ
jgi:hypothetical protein